MIGVAVTGLPSTFDSDMFSSSATNISFEVIDHDYSEQNIVSEDGINEVEVMSSDTEAGSSQKIKWSTWSPAMLKNPVSSVLQVTDQNSKQTQESVSNKYSTSVEATGPTVQLVSTVATGSKGVKRKKNELTADCRVKINALSESKLQLVELQKKMVEEEIIYKRKEHETKIMIMLEEHKYNIEKQKYELEILKKKLEKE